VQPNLPGVGGRPAGVMQGTIIVSLT
jgi:hypothetical protein